MTNLDSTDKKALMRRLVDWVKRHPYWSVVIAVVVIIIAFFAIRSQQQEVHAWLDSTTLLL